MRVSIDEWTIKEKRREGTRSQIVSDEQHDRTNGGGEDAPDHPFVEEGLLRLSLSHWHLDHRVCPVPDLQCRPE